MLPAPSPAERSTLVRDFKLAWETRDIERLIGLLDPHAVATADSGGLAPAFREPISGGEQIAQAWMAIAARGPAVTLLERAVNGQPGLVAQIDETTVSVYAFEVADGRITRIWAIRNPEKLQHCRKRALHAAHVLAPPVPRRHPADDHPGPTGLRPRVLVFGRRISR